MRPETSLTSSSHAPSSLPRVIKNRSLLYTGLGACLLSTIRQVFAEDTYFFDTLGLTDNAVRGDVAVSENAILVAGTIYLGSDKDYEGFLAKYDGNGKAIWNNTIGFPGGGPYGYDYDILEGIAALKDGGAVVTGDGAYQNLLLGKFNSSGELDWAKLFSCSGYCSGGAITETKNNTVTVVGTDFSGSGASVFLSRHDLATGEAIWFNSYDGEYLEYSRHISETRNGDLLIAGTSSIDSSSKDSASELNSKKDILIRRHNSTGAVIWSKLLGGPTNATIDEGTSAVEAENGNILITGYTKSYGAGGYDALTCRLTSSGSLLWCTTIGGSSSDYAQGVIESDQGELLIAGQTASTGAGSSDVSVCKLGATGQVTWCRAIGGSGADTAYAIAQGQNDSAVINGRTYSFGTKDKDMLLLKMPNNGSLSCASYWAPTELNVTAAVLPNFVSQYVAVDTSTLSEVSKTVEINSTTAQNITNICMGYGPVIIPTSTSIDDMTTSSTTTPSLSSTITSGDTATGSHTHLLTTIGELDAANDTFFSLSPINTTHGSEVWSSTLTSTDSINTTNQNQDHTSNAHYPIVNRIFLLLTTLMTKWW